MAMTAVEGGYTSISAQLGGNECAHAANDRCQLHMRASIASVND